MKSSKVKCLILLIVVLFIILKNTNLVYAFSSEQYNIVLKYEENLANFIYFDISDNNICIAFDNDKIYEYNKNGVFLRTISYSSSGDIYSYYKNNNLVIFDVRKKYHIVLDSTGKCIETFETSKATSGYYVGEDFSQNFIFEETGYKYEYINSNWFSRVFSRKKSKIVVSNDNHITLLIEENNKLIDDLIPIIIIVVIVSIFPIYGIIKKRFFNK